MLCRGLKVWVGYLKRVKGGRLRRLRDRVITLNEGDRDEENLSNLLDTKLEKNLKLIRRSSSRNRELMRIG
ncbi:hypothetical protein PVK06_011579 [Gossypium arboreum]|uniref:Uncharacterized protein n=1 Tax=Gossypium arboreum TaxID=29729 RepID=A0ABR0Q9P7_GOSAR|nr:hypothetical protein PVK06_011579 [Gossypium arboreum]